MAAGHDAEGRRETVNDNNTDGCEETKQHPRAEGTLEKGASQGKKVMEDGRSGLELGG